MNGGYVVLGGAGGIGSATARHLAERGAAVMVAGRTREPLEALAGDIGGLARQLDATDTGAVAAAVSDAAESFGAVAGVINCVGSLLLKPAHITSDEEWDETIATNLRSSFAAVKAGAGAMMRTGGGSIVLLSSAAAQTGLAHHEAIAAAKAGIIGLTRAAAASYAARNVRVNAVAPGMVRTPLTAHLTANPTSEQASVDLHALGRLGEPAQVASAIVWLLDQDWVTGQVLGVDGGLGQIRSRRG